jgi:hypothetical protein
MTRRDGGRVRSDGTLLGNVPTDDLADWLEERFGARGERLLTDPEIEPELAAQVTKWRREREAIEAELSDLSARHQDLVQQEGTAEEAEQVREAHGRVRERRVHAEERLAVLLVLQVLRETGDGTPDLEVAKRRIEDRLADEGLPAERLEGVPKTLSIGESEPEPDDIESTMSEIATGEVDADALELDDP